MNVKFRQTLAATLAAFVVGAIPVMGGVAEASGRQAGAKKNTGTRIEMKVTENGFEPAKLEVKKGEPVTLVITRVVDGTCATEITIDGTDINQKLPLNETVSVTFTPKKSGELKYGCAMGKMIGGVLMVK